MKLVVKNNVKGQNIFNTKKFQKQSHFPKNSVLKILVLKYKDIVVKHFSVKKYKNIVLKIFSVKKF